MLLGPKLALYIYIWPYSELYIYIYILTGDVVFIIAYTLYLQKVSVQVTVEYNKNALKDQQTCVTNY